MPPKGIESRILGGRSLEDQERIKEFEQKYKQFEGEMASVITRFFPSELQHFQQPSLERQYQKFYEIAAPATEATRGLRQRNFFRRLSYQQMPALMGEAAIRYFDDFIDDTVWPAIDTSDKEQLQKSLEEFCKESLPVIRKYVPNYPSEILDLPLLELDLELNPSQENFDSKIIALFDHKSLNVRYVESVMQGKVPDANNFFTEQQETLSFKALCIRDFSRDFEADNYLHETDMNLRNYLIKNQLNPATLITYLHEVEGALVAWQGSEEYTKQQSTLDLAICKKVLSALEEFAAKEKLACPP